MDIPAMSITLSQSKLQLNAGTMIMKKILNAARQNGEVMAQMLSESGAAAGQTPYLGRNVNAYI